MEILLHQLGILKKQRVIYKHIFLNQEHFAKYTPWYIPELIYPKIRLKKRNNRQMDRFNTDKPTRIMLMASYKQL